MMPVLRVDAQSFAVRLEENSSQPSVYLRRLLEEVEVGLEEAVDVEEEGGFAGVRKTRDMGSKPRASIRDLRLEGLR